MGPSGNTRSSTRCTRSRTRTRTSTRTRKSTRNQALKGQKNISINDQEEEEVVRTSTSSYSSTEDEFPKTEGLVFEAIDDDENRNNITMNNVTKCSNNNGCSTPKGQKFRIPEISTCPPAPKKRRLDESQSPSSASSFSVRRSPIAFFAPPDLELFFHRALRGISV